IIEKWIFPKIEGFSIMLKYFSLVLMSIMACCWQTSAWAGQCYNLARKEPSQLTGIIEYIIFPGPPNYEDVQNGDTPEPRLC
ncbi:hypothetical protein FBY58_1882, partial [Zymomonas mobilis]